MSPATPYQRLISSVPTLVVTAEIPESAPPEIREGLARRILVATTGRCPCGAELVVPDDLEPGTVTTVTIEHELDCPAVGVDSHA